MLTILYSQVHCQYWVTTKMKLSKILFECNHEEANTRMIFLALTAEDKCSALSKRGGYLVLMVFVYALNKINEKWNISELSSQKSFPEFMKLQGKTQLLFYMFLVRLKCLNGKEKLRILNTIGVSCKVSEC